MIRISKVEQHSHANDGNIATMFFTSLNEHVGVNTILISEQPTYIVRHNQFYSISLDIIKRNLHARTFINTGEV
jgi:hypothetical protein